ncbi:MAG: DUF2284 domain-containing protein [Oscillospiraceae bacterium]|nr:DUF2284 domain-containing protein [Oscillospiraceae bacterium]
MERPQLWELAEQIGFSHWAELNMDALEFLPEVRAMCAAERCGSYGHSWSCPPAIGTLADSAARVKGYTRGLLVQTTGRMEDAFDLEAIRVAERLHKRHFDALARQARQLWPDCLPMAAGSCTRCRQCTYPHRPCRYPGQMFPSMEAYGLWVSEVCRRSGLPYTYGPETITFTACILTKEL